AKFAPYLMVFLVFTFIYVILPNTKVSIKSAFIGGLIAAIAWQTTSWVFAFTVAKSTKYASIYSSLAVLILFMLWVYINWLIFLIGAQITYCHQNLRNLDLGRTIFRLSSKLKEKLALMIMFLIGRSFYYDEDKWTHEKLVKHLELPHDSIDNAITQLEEKKLILEIGEDQPYYLPATDIENIPISEIIDSARVNSETDLLESMHLSKPEVDQVTDKLEQAIHASLGELTLKDLVVGKADKSL
ncbi:MAG: YhjD/YihY/BrkB family envelope integrity protein, partial [Thermodesulfobacteriota bacterium]